MKFFSKNLIFIAITVMLVMLYNTCQHKKIRVKTEAWGEADGKPVQLYTVTNPNGMIMKMTDYGATLTELWVPDRNGNLDDVVLGFDNLKQYTGPHPYFGATVGRVANRIKNARFDIDGKSYQVTANEFDNCLHGAGEFNEAVWEVEVVENMFGTGLQFHHFSKDGTYGFPGNLDVYVTYTLTEENSVRIEYEAETDQATHIDMTHHTYFNLNGVKKPVYDHVAYINADRYTVLDDEFVATGELPELTGLPWDLSERTRLGDRIPEIPLNGYHHCYVLKKRPHALALAGGIMDPESGRELRVATTQPGLVFYAANALSDKITGKYGIRYGEHMAFCMEAQGLPNASNIPEFPSTLLRPGEKYHEVVIYDFNVVE